MHASRLECVDDFLHRLSDTHSAASAALDHQIIGALLAATRYCQKDYSNPRVLSHIRLPHRRHSSPQFWCGANGLLGTTPPALSMMSSAAVFEFGPCLAS